MIFRKIGLIGFFIFGFFIFNIGCFDDCNCSGVKLFFDVKEVNHNLYRESGDQLEELLVDESLGSNEQLNVEVNFDVDYISKINCNKNLMFGSLMACECAQVGSGGAKEERITKIQVETLVDFNDTYLAGSDITEIATVAFGFGSGKITYGIAEYLNDNSENIKYENFNLKLTEFPGHSEMQLKISIELNNGENYSFSTRNIKIN